MKKEFEELIIKYNLLDKAFDNIRLVDPTKNMVLDLSEHEVNDSKLKCFGLWGENKVCDNCVSLRAYQDNRPHAKLEYIGNDVYILIAIPIDLPERRVVMEIIKNATNSLIMNSGERDNYIEVYDLIGKVNNLALQDSLTGIFNKRYINERLPIEVANAMVSNKHLSLIMADIDFFKNINDSYGHLCGDHTLKKFSKMLSSCLSRETDWIARFGGEEFLICLPGANLKRAAEIAEVMRMTVEANTLNCGENDFTITASFGVSSVSPKMSLSMNELIEIADSKMYDAKRKGRNRVEA